MSTAIMMKKNSQQPLEAEKQDLLKIMRKELGKKYFDELSSLNDLLLEEEPPEQTMEIKINHKGAFYAC